MNEHELDRVIDTTAKRMVAGEPSGSTIYSVMARVREDAAPALRPFLWVTATVGVAALCGMVVLMMMDRTVELPLVETPGRLLPHVVASVPAPASMPGAETPQRRGTERRADRFAVASTPPDAMPTLSAIQPLTAEPIELPDIELPPLETRLTSIENIEIRDLTIEPLAASND
jgi:hypothetical protein